MKRRAVLGSSCVAMPLLFYSVSAIAKTNTKAKNNFDPNKFYSGMVFYEENDLYKNFSDHIRPYVEKAVSDASFVVPANYEVSIDVCPPQKPDISDPLAHVGSIKWTYTPDNKYRPERKCTKYDPLGQRDPIIGPMFREYWLCLRNY